MFIERTTAKKSSARSSGAKDKSVSRTIAEHCAPLECHLSSA